MSDDDADSTLFGRTAVRLGLIDSEQLADCLDLQRRLARGGGTIPLGKIMLAKGYIAARQIEEILRAQSRRAVACSSCGAEFAVDEAEEKGPFRCPACLRRIAAGPRLPSPPPSPPPKVSVPRREPAAAREVAGRPGPPEAPTLDERRAETITFVAPAAPAAPALGIRLECPGSEPREIDLPEGGRIEVGRALENDVKLVDPALSRRHCAFFEKDGRVFVEDLGSRNGTFVNGEAVARPRRLSPGDEVTFGPARVQLAARLPGRSTTEVVRAVGLCTFCGNIVTDASLASGKAMRSESGLVCETCLGGTVFPGKLMGKYRIIERIGHGGMAEVYRSEHAESSMIVALKVLSESRSATENARKRFVMEARAGARLEHPNLVRIYDAGEHEGLLYIVMEYVEGDDVAELLDRVGHLELGAGLDIGLDIAAALAYAHARGVIHRDVKPGNIILDRVWKRARLLDLGVAKRLDLDESERMTRSGVGLGTLDYAAPEQIESAKHAGPPADIYSLGAALYRIVVGVRPFNAESELGLAKAILFEELTWPEFCRDRVPEPFMRVVSRAMAKRPGDRYASADEFRAACARLREELLE